MPSLICRLISQAYLPGLSPRLLSLAVLIIAWEISLGTRLANAQMLTHKRERAGNETTPPPPPPNATVMPNLLLQVLSQYQTEGFDFLLRVFNSPDYLEELTGLSKLYAEALEGQVIIIITIIILHYLLQAWI